MKRLQLFQTNRPCDVVIHWQREGVLLLDPPYQRGDVWGPVRQRNLIRSILLGIPIPSVIINDRGGNFGEDYSYAVIDGKQRITAILKFLNSELFVPGEWFDMPGEVMFCELPVARQRGLRHTPIACSEGRLQSLEEEREVFELVNFGGVPQGESDLPTP